MNVKVTVCLTYWTLTESSPITVIISLLYALNISSTLNLAGSSFGKTVLWVPSEMMDTSASVSIYMTIGLLSMTTSQVSLDLY